MATRGILKWPTGSNRHGVKIFHFFPDIFSLSVIYVSQIQKFIKQNNNVKNLKKTLKINIYGRVKQEALHQLNMKCMILSDLPDG